MVKFVIALAEMFSAFAAKLHDMSEDMPNPIVLTSDDVIDIVKEAIQDGDIIAPKDESAVNTDDIYGLDRFIQNEIEEYDFRYTQDKRQFEEQTMALVLTYMFDNGMDSANVSVSREVEAMREHLSNRWTKWAETRTERENRKKAHIIADHIASQECPPSPHKLTIIPKKIDITNH
jgi:hypothetical protein